MPVARSGATRVHDGTDRFANLTQLVKSRIEWSIEHCKTHESPFYILLTKTCVLQIFHCVFQQSPQAT